MKTLLGIIIAVTMVMFPTNVSANTNIDFEELFENHQTVILIIEPDSGAIVYANQAAVIFYGFDLETLLTMNISEINQLSAEETLAEQQRALREERNFFVFPHQLASGEVRMVHVYSYPVNIDGQDYLYSIIIDQTLLVQTEQRNRQLMWGLIGALSLGLVISLGFLKFAFKQRKALELAQETSKTLLGRFDDIVKYSPLAIAVHDKELRYLHVSESYFTQFELTDHNIIGKHHYDVFPDLPKKWRDVHQRVLNGESLSADRDEYVRQDGTVLVTRWSCNPWYDEGQNIGGLIVYTEVIDHLIQKEKELEEAKAQLELVMDNLPIGIAVNSVSPKVSFNYMNERFPKLYGVTRDQLENGDFWEVVYEDAQDRETIKSRVLEDIASEEVSRMYWEAVPIRKVNQRTRYINAYATPVEGTPLMISSVMDVTDRVEKETQVRHASLHDPLTKLPNRFYYETQLHTFNQSQFFPLGLLMFDVNGLKLINDVYGSEAGDVILNEVAHQLCDCLKADEFLARIGGDEFALLIPNTSETNLEVRQRSLQDSLTEMTFIDITLSVASGSSIKDTKETPLNEFIALAENEMLRMKTLDQRSTRNNAIRSIFNTLQQKYEEEKVHSERVSRYCQMMGAALNLDDTALKELELAGLYHDIGKISIPDNILNKPGKLTDDEWEIMKSHTVIGYQILRTADQYSNLAEYALTHHERFDGLGYPNQLKGEDIPLTSRIIAVVDSYEAMTADRPYRKALSQADAIKELKKHAGTQWDPTLITLFVEHVIPKMDQ